MDNLVLIDTNLFLDDHNIIYKLSKQYEKVLVPITVLKELDAHKFKPDTSYSARNAIGSIMEFGKEYPEKIVFDTEIRDKAVENDEKIIEAGKRNGAVLATKDISMSIMAKAEGVKTKMFDVVLNNIFSPYIYIEMNDLYDKTMDDVFAYTKHYEGREYSKLLTVIAEISGRAIERNHWFFVMINVGKEEPVIYANDAIEHRLIRIDNSSEYRCIEVDGTIIKSRDSFQNCAIFALKEAPNVLITGRWGSGKTLLGTAHAISSSRKKTFVTRAPIGINNKYSLGFMPGPQPLDAKVLTPTGWTTMGEIKKGDFVIGRNGKKAIVIDTFDKGIRPVYKIETTNGSETEACGEHLWAVKDNNELKHGKDFELRSTLEIKENILNKNKGSKYNYTLPTNELVEFENINDLPIPPYTLGVLLGDGSFSNSISIINTDEELVKRVTSEVEQYGLYLLKSGEYQYYICGSYTSNKPPKPVKITNLMNNSECTYKSISVAANQLDLNKTTLNSRCVKNNIVDDTKYEFLEASRYQNYMKNSIYELGLEGKKAYNKFIPDIYKYTSINNRINLLKGLMDADGCIKKTTGYQSFTTTSEQLSNDIIEVARSLGINATKYTRNRIGNKSIIDNRTIKTNYITYEVSFPKDEQIELFYISRKRNLIQKPKNKGRCNKIKNIEYVGNKHVKCILIDNEDHLYITNDYIVTHNTKEDKMIDWVQGFLSALYYIYTNTRCQSDKRTTYDYVKDRIFKEKFEMLPMNSIQGLSLLENDVLIVDEAQLITVDYMSMILSRPSETGKLILLGDLKQTYNIVKPSESGLLKLLRMLPHKYLAYIELQNSYRSPLLEVADKLQDRTLV